MKEQSDNVYDPNNTILNTHVSFSRSPHPGLARLYNQKGKNGSAGHGSKAVGERAALDGEGPRGDGTVLVSYVVRIESWGVSGIREGKTVVDREKGVRVGGGSVGRGRMRVRGETRRGWIQETEIDTMRGDT